MKLSSREIRLGAMPRGYRKAYRMHCFDVWFCYPMPLHLIVRWWRGTP